VQKQIIYLGRPRRAHVKNGVKNYHGPTTILPRENTIPNYINFPHTFSKFCSDYDLNLCRCLNLELPPMRDFASLISVPVLRHDDFIDRTLSRQLVCTGIFFVRSIFFSIPIECRARGIASAFQNGAEVLQCVQAYRARPTYETPRRPPAEIESVHLEVS
jgi:hypothetical protein